MGRGVCRRGFPKSRAGGWTEGGRRDDGAGGADTAVRGDSTGSYEQWRTAGGF